MTATAVQTEWVRRVLGVEPPQHNGTSSAPPALAIWQSAKDDADTQLSALYDILKQTGIPVLAEVAGQIEAVLENYRVGLVKALLEYDQQRDPAKRGAALKVVKHYQATLASDAHVTAADTNPFGVPVSVRTTLGAALTTLEHQLSA